VLDKDMKKVAADLRRMYTAIDRDHAEHELEALPISGIRSTR
jgi:hypothetical protein